MSMNIDTFYLMIHYLWRILVLAQYLLNPNILHRDNGSISALSKVLTGGRSDFFIFFFIFLL